MATITFVLRPSTKKGRHAGSLSLRVVHDRKVKTLTLPCRLYAEEWDAEGQIVIYPANDLVRTAALDEMVAVIADSARMFETIIATLEKQGLYSVDDIVKKFHRKRNDGKLLGWVETLAAELTRNGQHRLARAFRTVSGGLVKYNRNTDIPLTHINACLIKGFEKELMEKGKKPNTISYYMRNLRSIYNKAVAAGRIPSRREDPFVGVYTKVKATAKRALSIEETTKLYEIDFDAVRSQYLSSSPEWKYVDNLNYSWRLFMFCFFAQGMCFIDMAYLRKENIKGGVCTYYRKKTGQQVEVTVNEGMQRIIDSFAQDVKGSPYLFPIITGEGEKARTQYESALRTQNRRLKALAKLAGIGKEISTHVSRHSFATIVRVGGLPAGVISEMLGHSTEKMTHNYFASFDRTVFDQAYHILTEALSRPTALAPAVAFR